MILILKQAGIREMSDKLKKNTIIELTKADYLSYLLKVVKGFARVSTRSG